MFLAALLLAGCSTAQPADDVRKATYPPSFAYMSRAAIRTEMHKLAAGVAELDALLRAQEAQVPADQEAVAGVLKEIDGIVAGLAESGKPTGHTTLDENLDRFRRDIRAAYEGAMESPPDYFLAGTITGSCVYCHK